MTILSTDLIRTIPQQPNGQAGVLDQYVPISQAALLTATFFGPQTQYTAVSGNTPATLTGPQEAGSPDLTINMTAALAGAGTLNSATAAQIVAAIPNAVVGYSYRMRIINSSSGNFAWTLTTNTGITLNGTMTIAQNTYRDFYVTLTSLTAVAIQSAGTGTNS